MEHHTLAAGSLLLYSQHAYGGWTAHIRDQRRQCWLHQGHTYFATTEEAQAAAIALATQLTGEPIDNSGWIGSFG